MKLPDDNDLKRRGELKPTGSLIPFSPPTAANAQQPARAIEAFELVAIADIPEIIEQTWLIEGLLPTFAEGCAGYIFGLPKTRKSLMLADLALSVATGTPAMGRFKVHRTGTVVGYFAEDPRGETSRRVHRLARARGIDVPRNLLLVKQNAIAIDDAEHQARLLATLQAVPDLALVFLDPLVRLHSANENKAEELAPIHTFLRSLSRSLPGVVVVLAHHANKADGARGSTELTAFGDFNIYCRAPDEQATEVHKIENRGGPPGKPFKFSVEDGMTDEGAPTLQLVAEEMDGSEAATRSSAVEEQVVAFKAAHHGMSGREAIKQLRVAGVKVKDGEFWGWWKNG